MHLLLWLKHVHRPWCVFDRCVMWILGSTGNIGEGIRGWVASYSSSSIISASYTSSLISCYLSFLSVSLGIPCELLCVYQRDRLAIKSSQPWFSYLEEIKVGSFGGLFGACNCHIISPGCHYQPIHSVIILNTPSWMTGGLPCLSMCDICVCLVVFLIMAWLSFGWTRWDHRSCFHVLVLRFTSWDSDDECTLCFTFT